jgi:hypothetical protein
MKFRPMGAELFHADRETYVHEASSSFQKFCEYI